jgi:hypothetical protein
VSLLCKNGKRTKIGMSVRHTKNVEQKQGLEQVAPSASAAGTYWEALPGAAIFAPLPSPPFDPTLPDNGDNGDGYTNSYPLFSPNTNLLFLQISNISSGTAYASLHNATNQVYAIWSTPDLTIPFDYWQVETELFPTTATTNILPFIVSTLGRQDLFLRAQDWTGVYANGLPCWWTWEYFHTLDLSWTNQDANGNTLGDDYTNSTDPDTITFTIAVTNIDVNTATPNLPLDIIQPVRLFDGAILRPHPAGLYHQLFPIRQHLSGQRRKHHHPPRHRLGRE